METTLQRPLATRILIACLMPVLQGVGWLLGFTFLMAVAAIGISLLFALLGMILLGIPLLALGNSLWYLLLYIPALAILGIFLRGDE